jgi:hypothetical protein
MNIVVQRCDLDCEGDLLISALRRFLTPDSDQARFNWLYRNNPHGRAAAWLMRDTLIGEVIGAAAAFPRRVMINERPGRCWVLGDFCVSDRHRSLGPAVKLQRACLDVLSTDRGEFCYNFPSAAMMAVYRRLAVTTSSALVRFAKPLRADRFVRRSLGNSVLGGMISRMANAALRLRDWKTGDLSGVEVALHSGPCGEEFTILAGNAMPSHGVVVERTADYLNWRYLAYPRLSYEILTARNNGVLTGYAVFSQEGEDATISDCVVKTDRRTTHALLGALVSLLRERNVALVNVPILMSHPLTKILIEVGFRPRESTPMVVYPLSYTADHGAVQWHVMSGDRDS